MFHLFGNKNKDLKVLDKEQIIDTDEIENTIQIISPIISYNSEDTNVDTSMILIFFQITIEKSIKSIIDLTNAFQNARISYEENDKKISASILISLQEIQTVLLNESLISQLQANNVFGNIYNIIIKYIPSELRVYELNSGYYDSSKYKMIKLSDGVNKINNPIFNIYYILSNTPIKDSLLDISYGKIVTGSFTCVLVDNLLGYEKEEYLNEDIYEEEVLDVEELMAKYPGDYI